MRQPDKAAGPPLHATCIVPGRRAVYACSSAGNLGMRLLRSLRPLLVPLQLAFLVVGLPVGGVSAAHASPPSKPQPPILVVTSPGANFSGYYAEILRAEGFNEFAVADVSTVTATSLIPYDVVLLAKGPVSSAQVSALTEWVNAGGNLIAMDPSPVLGELLGLTISEATLKDGYIAVDTTTNVGRGIVGETLQYHGTATLHKLNGATALATLYENASEASGNSAISLRQVGPNGGEAAAFAYDLARSVVYTRQGNPAWIGQERDGTSPIRPNDLFYGDATFDRQPDWVDRTKIGIPQADEQQRLLANLILAMNVDRKPLPRFWYLPHGHKAAVVMTGDDHGTGGTRARWREFLRASPPGCRVDQWECIRGTSYMFPNTPMPNGELGEFEARGFEAGLHINTDCGDFSRRWLSHLYATQLRAYSLSWPASPPVRTMRHHCIAWSDWASVPRVQFANGIRLDTSYYYWPPNWVNNTPGHFTGSAIPMRYADVDGSIIDVYQVVTQMTDESEQKYPFTVDTLLDRALGREEQYGVYTINAHTDEDTIPESTLTIASAKKRRVPVITAQQLLTWLDGRNQSSFESITYSEGTLQFTIRAANGANGLQAMLPRKAGTRTLVRIVRDSTDVPYRERRVKGVEYAMFSAPSGVYSAQYAEDSTLTSSAPAHDGAGKVLRR